MIALLNAPVLTAFGIFSFERVDMEKARMLAAGGVHSFIGHQSTCDILSLLLEVEVTLNRAQYQQQPHEQALVFKLTNRLAAGEVLNTLEAITAQGYELGLLERIQ